MNLWGGNYQPDERGASEIVGIILLFGMVLAGVALVVLAGGSLLDTLQSQSESEQVEFEFESASDQIYQSIQSGDTRSIPDTDATRTIEEESTTVTVQRLNVTGSGEPDLSNDIEWPADTENDARFDRHLDALVYHEDDSQYVFEGGGEWRVANGHPTVHSPPRIDLRYSEENGLNIDLVDIDAASTVSDGELLVEPATTGNAIDQSELEAALYSGIDHNDPDVGDDIAIRIDSDYAEAWEATLTQSQDLNQVQDAYYFGIDEDGIDSDDDIVIVIRDKIEPLFEISDIDADDTVVVDPGESDDGTLEIEPTIENFGETSGQTDVNLTLESPTGDTYTRNESAVEISPDDPQTVEFEIDASTLKNEFEPVDEIDGGINDVWQYGLYQWEIETTGGGGSGEFFVTGPDEFLRLNEAGDGSGVPPADRVEPTGDGITVDKGVDTVDLTTEFTNIGDGEADIEPEIELHLDPVEEDELTLFDSSVPGQDPPEVSADPWEQSGFTIPLNRSELAAGNYTYVVDVSDQGDFCTAIDCVYEAEFDIEPGDDVNVSPDELTIPGDTEVDASLIGTELTNEAGIFDRYGDPIYDRVDDNVRYNDDFFGAETPYPEEQAVIVDDDGERLSYSEADDLVGNPLELQQQGNNNDYDISVLAPEPSLSSPSYETPDSGITEVEAPSPGDTGGFFADDRWINGVSIGDITLQSGNDDGYGNYRDRVAQVEPGDSLDIEVDPYVSCSGIFCSDDPQHVSVWFDFDGDGTFEDAERHYLGSSTGDSLSETVEVPDDAEQGIHAVRIIQRENHEPTDPYKHGESWDGEAEDYSIQIGSQYIESVSFGDQIDHESGPQGGYADFSSDHRATVEPGASYDLDVDVSGEEQHVTAWFDFDGTGEFNHDVHVGATSDGTVSTMVDIPEDASGGDVRFRVMTQSGEYPDDPNEDGAWTGEAEDYGIVIPPAPQKNPAGGWVDPEGSVPEWDEHKGWWEWSPETLQWSNDGGYDLAVEENPGAGTYRFHNIPGTGGPGGNYEIETKAVEHLQQLEPLTASVVASDSDTGEELQRLRFQPDGGHANVTGTSGQVSFADNLNDFDTQYESFQISGQTMRGSVTFEASRWECDQWGYGGVDDHDGTTYYAIECVDFADDGTTVDVSDQDVATADDGFIRTRDADNRSIDLPSGLLDTQRNFDEIFDDGTEQLEGLNVGWSGVGPDLDDGEAAFLMELEMDLGTFDPGHCGTGERPDGLLGNFGVSNSEPNSYAPRYDGPYDGHLQASPDYTGINQAAWDIAQRYTYGTSNAHYVETNRKFGPDWNECGGTSLIRTTQPNFNDAVAVLDVETGEGQLGVDPVEEIEDLDGETIDADINTEDINVGDSSGINVGVDEVHIN